MASATEYVGEALLFPKPMDDAGYFVSHRAIELEYMDVDKWIVRIHKYWHYSVYVCILYIVTIFGIQRFMRDRPKFHLRGPLVAWNLSLCLFSMVGAIRCVSELSSQATRISFYSLVCDKTVNLPNTGSAYAVWGTVFVLSKLVELGDTMFIVLRKQKLIFLHWYHHVTVLVFCFHSYSELASLACSFCTMNLIVHTFMYLYYAIRAAGYRLPKHVCMGLTFLQIAQMVGGCLLLAYTFAMKSQGLRCDISNANLAGGGLMYFSYFVLFAKFFYDAYMCKPKLQKRD